MKHWKMMSENGYYFWNGATYVLNEFVEVCVCAYVCGCAYVSVRVHIVCACAYVCACACMFVVMCDMGVCVCVCRGGGIVMLPCIARTP